MEKGFWESVKQFFSPKEQVHDHWYAPVAGFHFESDDFYKRIQTELEARKVPGLGISRVEFSEGGMLSAKREYLRLSRERLVFDICAAPFGTGYFFSFRFVELPLGVKPGEMLVFLIGIVLVFSLLMRFLGIIWGTIALLALIGAGIWIMRNAVALGLKDLDATLLKTPVIGPIYEVLCRKETYYREDTRLMYLSTVNDITKALVEEITVAKGIKIKRYERKPVLGHLYAEKTTGAQDSLVPEAGG